MRILLFVLVGLVLVASEASEAHAQKNCTVAVPPSGASIDVTTHPAYMTTVNFWEALGSGAGLGTLSGYEVVAQPPKGFGIHPTKGDVGPGNIAVTTKSGVRVAVAVSVVTDKAQACAFVTVELVTEAEAFRRQVEAAVAERTAALERELVAARTEVAERVQTELDREVARRAVRRRVLSRTNFVARNEAQMIVRVGEVLYLGDSAVIAFEVQNRSKVAVSIAAVELTAGRGDEAAAVEMEGADDGVGVGRVASNGMARGVVVVRSVVRLRGKALALRVSPTAGHGDPVVVRGIGLK